MRQLPIKRTSYGFSQQPSYLALEFKRRAGKSVLPIRLRLRICLLTFLSLPVVNIGLLLLTAALSAPGADRNTGHGSKVATRYSAVMTAFGMSSCAAQRYTHPASINYVHDNGNYGSVAMNIQYYFVGSTLYYYVHDITVGYSKKMMETEKELYAAVYNKKMCSQPDLINNVEVKVSADVHFGTTKLAHADVSITGFIYGVGETKKQFTHFTEPAGAEKITREYHEKHNSNLYTDNCTIFDLRVARLALYNLDKAINDLRTELKRNKQEIQRQFDALITQASLQSNLNKFELALSKLSEAKGFIRGNNSRQQKYNDTKSAIEARRQSEQQQKADLAAREKQKALQADRRTVASKTAAAQRGQHLNSQGESQYQHQNKAYAPASSAGRDQTQTQSGATTHTGALVSSPKKHQLTGFEATAYKRTPEYRQALRDKARAEYDQKQQQQRAYEQAQQARKEQLARDKAEAARERIEQMKRQIQDNQRKAQEIEDASHTLIDGLTSSSNNPVDVLNAARPLAMKFAQQGNALGAYGSIGAGVLGGVLKMSAGNRKRKEAERAEAERRAAIKKQQEAERKKREAEAERLRREAFRLLIDSRHTVLNTFDQHNPIPLSTANLAEDRIYYFLYALDSSTFNTAKTTIYVSNVFAIERYKDGTWPYQSSILQQISSLTPQTEIFQGYYLDQAEAEEMRDAFVSGFSASDGVRLAEFEYRKGSIERLDRPLPASGSVGTGVEGGDRQEQSTGSGLGISLKTGKASQADQKSGLGIPLGSGTKKTGTTSKDKPHEQARSSSGKRDSSGKQTEKAGNKTGGDLGIPIK